MVDDRPATAADTDQARVICHAPADAVARHAAPAFERPTRLVCSEHAAPRTNRLTAAPASLVRHTQAVLQGAFILVNAVHDHAAAIESVDHLTSAIQRLFQAPDTAPGHKEATP